MSVPNTFATSTTAIPLVNLDANFQYYDNAYQITSTSISFTGAVTLAAGTANGVAYLNGSKVLTTGSALTFDGTNLGVGTTPTEKLDVYTNSTANTSIKVANTSGSLQMLQSNGIAYLYTATNQPIAFSTNNSEQMRLTSTGLGIGTSSPGYKLDVRGEGFVGTAVNSGIRMVNIGGVNYIQSGNAGAAAPLQFGNWYSNGFMTLDSSGNLGLGVTPSAWGVGGNYEMPGSSIFMQRGDANYASNGYYNGGWKYASTGFASYYSQTASAHKWWTAPFGTAGAAISFTQAMTLDASGNLLVGTTSAVNSSFVGVVFDAATKNGLVLRTAANTSGAGFALFADNSGNTCGNIFRVGTTSAVTYAATSDYRLKTVIGPVANSGQRIDALKPVEYIWKNGGERTSGFLAHQFQEVYASSVSGSKDAVDAEGNPVYQSMQAGSAEVIADLVAELQSLRQRLAAAGIA